MDKHLMQEMAKYFDEYKEGVTKAWVNEIKEARAEKRNVDLSTVMNNMPNASFERFTRLFNEAEERIEAKYKTKDTKKVGLFGR